MAAQPMSSNCAAFCSGDALHQAPRLAFELQPCILMRLAARNGGDAPHESKMLSGLRFSSPRTASMTFDISAFEKPFLCKKLSRSSSVRATIRCSAAAMPATNGADDELAKFVNAGAASWAKRCAANFECRIVICSKFSTPQRLRFMQTARRWKLAMPSVLLPTSLFQ